MVRITWLKNDKLSTSLWLLVEWIIRGVHASLELLLTLPTDAAKVKPVPSTTWHDPARPTNY